MTEYIPPDNAIGYREIKIHEDSTEMCNDALVWGAGYGGETMVFSRHEDATSQTNHGRWQKGDLTSGVYKQATVNALATSYVEGSPAAHRAQKNPKRSVELVTDSSVFNVGDVVPIACSPFSYTDILPIRTVAITFPTPYRPRYALQMSWEIDADWAMSDPWLIPGDKGQPTGGDGGGKPPGSDITCPSPDGGQFLNTTLPVFTDDFNRASGTQPNGGLHGYWGNSVGTSTPPTFTNPPGLEMGNDYYIWLDTPMGAGVQFIAKMNVTNLFTIGDLCGISYDVRPGFGYVYGLWVADGTGTSSTRVYDYPTGNVFVRYVNYPGLYSAAKIWAQGSVEPSTWTITGAPQIRTSLLTNLAIDGYLSHLQSITIFAEVDPVTPAPVSMPPDTTTVGNLSMSWYHAWPFNEPFRLYWVAGNFDDFWGIVAQENPVWSTEASSRVATNLNSYHSVGIVWSAYHIYGPYTRYAHHQTEAVTIPTGHGPTGSIRVTGTVSVTVDYAQAVGSNRTHTVVPVTVDLDVYDYGEGEPYWLGPPYAALGRTAASVYAAPEAGDYFSGTPGVTVTVPFSFDVPADMLTAIDVAGGFQWGVKIYDPEGALSNLSGQGNPYPFALANMANASATVNGGSLQYAVSYAQGGGTSYFCTPATVPVPASGIGSRVDDQLVPEGVPGGEPYPAGTEWHTTSASYVPGSTRLAIDGAFQFSNYDETDPGNGIITINIPVGVDRIVTLSYLTNGLLP